jgi:tRNA (guanine37-N1)-methyltransferase
MTEADGTMAGQLRIAVVSLFPEMIQDAARCGVVGRAFERELASLQCVNPRDFTSDVHQSVDDRPYGGGPGMVLKAEPFAAAIESVKQEIPGGPVVFLTPQGRRFDQQRAERLAREPGLILVAGRYEGFDERLTEQYADDELSLGDFVLSGGELAALAVIDAVVRLLPGALGDALSAEQDSFGSGLLDYPHYTRPEVFAGLRVPAVLAGGDHMKIARWRLKQALGRTWARRPDLLDDRALTKDERELLQEFVAEYNARNELMARD